MIWRKLSKPDATDTSRERARAGCFSIPRATGAATVRSAPATHGFPPRVSDEHRMIAPVRGALERGMSARRSQVCKETEVLMDLCLPPPPPFSISEKRGFIIYVSCVELRRIRPAAGDQIGPAAVRMAMG